MKKIIVAAAIVCAAAFANAAAVGWSAAGMTNYKGDAYSFFIIGQKGVTDISTVTALLDAGTDVSSYALGSGKVSNTGTANRQYSASGVTLGEGSYTGFYVLFDTETPTAGTSKYVVISGQSGLTKTIGAFTANTTFAAANVGTFVNDSSHWSAYGSVPEPTSGLMLLLGMAGLALKRKVA